MYTRPNCKWDGEGEGEGATGGKGGRRGGCISKFMFLVFRITCSVITFMLLAFSVVRASVTKLHAQLFTPMIARWRLWNLFFSFEH